MVTIIYLIRHSETLVRKDFDLYQSNDSIQSVNEKIIVSVEGEKKAQRLSECKELQNLDAVWTSNYVRAIATAKYLAYKNDLSLNLDQRLDERKYGIPHPNEDKLSFWREQYLRKDYKNEEGESQEEVRNRMYNVIEEVVKKYKSKRIALVSHGTSISFLLLKWCTLKEVDVTKRRHILYQGKILINEKFHAPEVFKVVMEEDCIPLSIERILLQ